MDSFRQFIDLDKRDDNFIDECLLCETNFSTSHRRDVTSMVFVLRGKMLKLNHNILNHETMPDGSHVITHRTPKNTIRVTTVKSVKNGANNTTIQNRPATNVERKYYNSTMELAE